MTVFIKSHVSVKYSDHINFDYGKNSWCHKCRRLTVVDPDLQIRRGGWGGHPDPEMRGGGGLPPKKIFSALQASFWSENKDGGPGPPGPSPGSATEFNTLFLTLKDTMLKTTTSSAGDKTKNTELTWYPDSKVRHPPFHSPFWNSQ